MGRKLPTTEFGSGRAGDLEVTDTFLVNDQYYADKGETDVDAIITKAKALGATKIYLHPDNTYTVNSSITQSLAGLTIDGRNCTINNGVSDTYIFQVGGDVTGDALTLASNATIGTPTVVLDDASSLAAGDWIRIHSDATIGSAATVKIGELHQIESIATNTLTLQGRLDFGYTTANNAVVTKIAYHSDITLKNINFQGQGSGNNAIGLFFQFCEYLTIVNCKVQNFGYAGIGVISCRDYLIDNCDCSYNKKASVGYGVYCVDLCKSGVVRDCTFIDCRHGITHGASATNIGLVSDILNKGCTFIGTTEAGFDTHDTSGYKVSIENSYFQNCLYGIKIQSSRVIVANNRLINCGTNGATDFAIKLTGNASNILSDVVVTGNIVTSTAAAANGYGINGDYCYNVNIVGNQVTKYGSGIYFVTSVEDLTITSNSVDDCLIGIRLGSGVLFVSVLANKIIGATSDGISAQDVTHGVISGNFIYNSRDGILLLKTTQNHAGISVLGNHIFQCSQRGMQITKHDNLRIEGNYIIEADKNNTDVYPGINLVSCDFAMVNGNTSIIRITGSTQLHGIWLDADCDQCVVTNNNFRVNKTWAWVNSGTNTVFRDNVLPAGSVNQVPAAGITTAMFRNDNDVIEVTGSAEAVLITASGNIANGWWTGQRLRIRGTDDTNTLHFQDISAAANSKMELFGQDVTLGSGEQLNVEWDGNRWVMLNNVGIKEPRIWAYVADVKAPNTDGGNFGAGAWRTRTLTAIDGDIGSHISLANNQITLTSGTYYIRGSAPAYQVNRHRTRFYNITGSSTAIEGASSVSLVSSATIRSTFEGEVSIGSNNVFEVLHRCQTTGSPGFGLNSGFNEGSEIYTQVYIEKMSRR